MVVLGASHVRVHQDQGARVELEVVGGRSSGTVRSGLRAELDRPMRGPGSPSTAIATSMGTRRRARLELLQLEPELFAAAS